MPASTKYACRECGSLPVTVALAASKAWATVCPPKTRSKRPGSPSTRKRSPPSDSSSSARSRPSSATRTARSRDPGGPPGASTRSEASGLTRTWLARGRRIRTLPGGRCEVTGVRPMLSGEKILITGPAGRIAFGLARSLAADNEVWGIARFSDPATREKVEALGVTTRRSTSPTDEFGDLPDRLHLPAAPRGRLQRRRLRPRTAGERRGTGFVLEHCRTAKAALVMSTVTVYKPHPDPWHAFREDDPLGDAMAPPSAPYSVSKIAEEAVARVLRPIVRPAGHDRSDVRRVQRSGRAPGLASGCDRRGRARPDPLGSHALQPDSRRRHLLAARAVARRRERAGDDRELGRRRAGERAGVVRLLRRAAGRGGEGGGRGDPRRVDWIGRGPHEAQRDHRPVPCRLARRVSPRGGAVLPGPRAARRSERTARVAYPRSEVLLAEAMQATGLSDFGPGDFREGLDVLLESLERDGDLSPATDAGVIGDFRRRLVNRLEVEAWYARPSRDRAAHGAGTGRHQRTAAHRHHGPRQHDVARSAVPLPARVGAVEAVPTADARRRGHRSATAAGRARERAALARAQGDAPLRRSTRRWRTPRCSAWRSTGSSTRCPSSATTPGGATPTSTPTYDYHRRVVKLLHSQRPPDLWLFKAPHHNFHLEAIVAAYPDVRFVMTHRDPAKAVPSWASIVSTIFPAPRGRTRHAKARSRGVGAPTRRRGERDRGAGAHRRRRASSTSTTAS